MGLVPKFPSTCNLSSHFGMEEDMSRFKLIGFVALITLAFGIAIVTDVLAGEKLKFRAAWSTVKEEALIGPGGEGRTALVFENRGILTALGDSNIFDGMTAVDVGFGDLDKRGTGFGHGTVECTDRDGDKIYIQWEAEVLNGVWSGPGIIARGTGKFEGLEGKTTHGPCVRVGPYQVCTSACIYKDCLPFINRPCERFGPDYVYAVWEGELE
jgi:hypothetical protein